MRRLAMATSLIALGLHVPALAQDHAMHAMGGMAPPAETENERKEPAPPPPASAGSSPDHAEHRMHMALPTGPASQNPEAIPDMDHAGHDMQAMGPGAHHASAASGMQMTGTALPAGDAPPPPVQMDHYADRDFPPDVMARARATMMKEQGAAPFGQILLNRFEYQGHEGPNTFRWDGEGWYGTDLNRLWIKSEGEGAFGGGIDSVEVQALYSRAVDPFFNIQAGVRQDFARGPDRTYATVGFEGLAPGFFEIEGAVFLSTRGDLLGRIEGYYDQRVTQRLILQPRAEVNVSAQNVPDSGIGSGLVDFELGARLRYEITRQFAPYLGVSLKRETGATARLSRMAGRGVRTTGLVAGVRMWF